MTAAFDGSEAKWLPNVDGVASVGDGMECTPSALHRSWRDSPLDRSPGMGCPAHAPRDQNLDKNPTVPPLLVSPSSPGELSPAWLGGPATA